MKKLLATTAITVMAAMPALAQSNTTAAAQGETFYASVPDAVKASDFIGKRVYAADPASGDTTDMDNIGEVKDIVFGSQGDVDAVLVDVGGFLGIGEKTVAVNLDALDMQADGDSYRLVMEGNKEALENAPAYTPAMDNMDEAANAAKTGMSNAADETGQAARNAGDDLSSAAENAADWTKDKAAAAGAAVSGAASEAAGWTKEKTAQAGDAMQDAGQDMSQAADNGADNMKSAADTPANPTGTPITDWTSIAASDLDGKTVYGPNDESIGKVSNVVTDTNDGITQVVVNVGGFLGLGSKPVALTPDQMEVTKNGDNISIHVAATQDELEQMPEYTG